MYDFDTVIDRVNSSSKKWAFPNCSLPFPVKDKPLPMWIADMDFKSPPCVLEALNQAVDYGIFGYVSVPDSTLDAVVHWQKEQHQWTIRPEWISFTHSVVTAIALVVQAFSQEGDSVLIQPPVYGPFTNTPSDNKRHIIGAQLKEEAGQYVFDAEAFEAAITPDTKIFILCNPHNPIGKVWTLEELTLMGEICLKHNILVLADEIHQDFVLNESKKYIPFASICQEFADISVTCTAPSKTFNLAGLQTATVIISNPKLRKAFLDVCARLDIMQSNLLGLVACEAAYTDGSNWLVELKNYLRGNVQLIEEVFSEIDNVELIRADALYLAWLDFRKTGLDNNKLQEHLLTKAGVWLDNGLKFGPAGNGFARLNFSCPRSVLAEGLEKIKQVF